MTLFDKMSELRAQLKIGLRAGIRKGWGSFVWICKIIIPVSFVAVLLQWTGWLSQLDFLLHPLMNVINLPAAAALPIIVAMTVSFYAGIAIMVVLPFTIAQIILIALFMTTAHMLIVEGIVQHRSGLNFIKATLVRIGAAILCVFVVSQFFANTSQSVSLPVSLATQTPFIEILKTWAIDTLRLIGRILIIIMLVMMALHALESLGWIKYLVRFFRPLMKILGLSDRAATMWVTGAGFGLLYGSAVIMEEAKKENLTKEELEHLQISIGVNHSIVEEPALFLALGVNPLWLLIPRFVTATLAVHALRGLQYLKRKLLSK
ncbi:MAG: iron transporter [Dehalococcoidia bacterium]|nr:iron transporter [Dehalococcoidia bacterium]